MKSWLFLFAGLVVVGCKSGPDATPPSPNTNQVKLSTGSAEATAAPTPSSTIKLHWNEEKAKGEDGTVYRVGVPDKFTLETDSRTIAFPGSTTFVNKAGDKLAFRTSTKAKPEPDLNSMVSLYKSDTAAPKIDVGAYSIYEDALDMSSAKVTSGPPIHIPHSSFTGLVISHSGDTVFQVSYSTDASLADAKAIGDQACRWVAAHN